MMFMRKSSNDGRKKMSLIQRVFTGYTVDNSVDKVLSLVDDMQNSKNIPQYLKDDLDWITEVIISNKLYQVNVEETGSSKNTEAINAWIDPGGVGVAASAGSLQRGSILETKSSRGSVQSNKKLSQFYQATH